MADTNTYTEKESVVKYISREKFNQLDLTDIPAGTEYRIVGDGIVPADLTAEMWNTLYPVGSIYMSTNNTSPASLFTSTWERIQDRFLLAAGSSYTAGSTGGSANAILVEHGSHLVGLTGSYWLEYGNANGYFLSTDNVTKYGTISRGWNLAGGNEIYPAGYTAGESGTGKNMPPYLTVYMWKRTK